MSHKIARYTVSNGLVGCYMPDNVSGPMMFSTRRELASHIRHEIEMLDWPANTFDQVKIRRLWSFIARNGSSVAHFSIQYKGYELAFHGLTKAEFDAAEKECDQ